MWWRYNDEFCQKRNVALAWFVNVQRATQSADPHYTRSHAPRPTRASGYYADFDPHSDPHFTRSPARLVYSARIHTAALQDPFQSIWVLRTWDERQWVVADGGFGVHVAALHGQHIPVKTPTSMGPSRIGQHSKSKFDVWRGPFPASCTPYKTSCGRPTRLHRQHPKQVHDRYNREVVLRRLHMYTYIRIHVYDDIMTSTSDVDVC